MAEKEPDGPLRPENETDEPAPPSRSPVALFMGDLMRAVRWVGRKLRAATRSKRVLIGVAVGVLLVLLSAGGVAVLLLPQLGRTVNVQVSAVEPRVAEPTATPGLVIRVVKAVLPTPTPPAIERAVRLRTPVPASADVPTGVPVEAQVPAGAVRAFPVATATPTPGAAATGPPAPTRVAVILPAGAASPPVRLVAVTEDARGQVVMRFTRAVRMEGESYLTTDIGVSLGLVAASRQAVRSRAGSRTLVWERRYVPDSFFVTGWDRDSVWGLADLDGNDAAQSFDPVRVGPIAEAQPAAAQEPEAATLPLFMWADVYEALPEPKQTCIASELGVDALDLLAQPIVGPGREEAEGVVERTILKCLDPDDLARLYDVVEPVNLFLDGVAQREKLSEAEVDCAREAILSTDLASILEAEEPGAEWVDLQANVLRCLAAQQ